MSGLARICKLYGSMILQDKDGNKEVWLWDYKNDKPRLKSEMTKSEISESEKAKWMALKDEIQKADKLPTTNTNHS
jgi:hypothetical protein